MSFLPGSCPKCLHSLPPSPRALSQCGGRELDGKEQEEGQGQQEFKTTNKNQEQERRKKEKTTKKARSSWGRFNKKRKNKKLHLGKKENKKKILCIISKFCGETSRYWALFLKISSFFDSLQMLTFLKSDRLLVRNRNRLLMF